jgi:hypothetical protein
MALRVTYKSPAHDKGTEVDIAGLGGLKQGEAVTLTADQEMSFYSTHGDTVQNRLKNDPNFKVEGTPELKKGDIPDVSDVNESALADTPAEVQEGAGS